MGKGVLSKALLNRLRVFVKPFGFTFVSRMDWFVRKGAIHAMYRLDFYGGRGAGQTYSVSPSVAIRIDEVEDIYHRISGFEPQYQRDTPTIWTSIKDLQRSDQNYEYLLNDVHDIDPVAEQLFGIFENIALPFLEQNSSVEALDFLLNSSPESENSIFCPPVPRFYRGAIIAKLVQRKDFEQVLKIYRAHLSRIDARYEREFEKLINILEHS